jgi:predicted nucleotidyltransferase component of viral defense system
MRSCTLSENSLTLQDILEVQAHFGLPSPALVEKDWHVIKALAAIARAPVAPLQLVFGGGTALSRAYRLIRRMSEDIDLRIIEGARPSRARRRQLRDTLTTALLEAGFVFDPANTEHCHAANESRYTRYQLPYAPLARGAGVLRPTIQVETAVWPLRRPAVRLPVASFVAEAFQRPAEVPVIACVSIAEMAADKFVALTRRIGAERARLDANPDPTLIRHLYDLHVIRAHYDVAEVAALAREIMHADAEAYGNQFPAYRQDPLAETRQALAAIAIDNAYAAGFSAFQRDMVFGDRVSFAAGLATLGEITERLGG